MLKKEYCKKCWENEDGWTEHDEKEWNNGVVWCPFQHKKKYYDWEKIKITEEPPNRCPFLLEHVI